MNTRISICLCFNSAALFMPRDMTVFKESTKYEDSKAVEQSQTDV